MFTPRILKLAVDLSFDYRCLGYIHPLLPCHCFEASFLKLGTSLGWHGEDLPYKDVIHFPLLL